MAFTAPRAWRKGVIACTVLSYVVLAVNIGLIIWSQKHSDTDQGSNIVKRGDCQAVLNANIWAHVGINILSSFLLAASSYCMQVVLAPTRQDVDRAHSKFQWLDIGIPSLRNFKFVAPWRRVVWVVLCMSSLPLHLVYNSAFFTSQVATEYLVAELDESYLQGGATLTNITSGGQLRDRFGITQGSNLTLRVGTFERMLRESPKWEKLSVEDCARLYTQPVLITHRGLVLVVPSTPEHSQLPGLWKITGSHSWMCDLPADEQYKDKINDVEGPGALCTPTTAGFRNRTSQWKTPSQPLYCLAEPLPQDCKLEVNAMLLGVVCVTNLIKCITMTGLVFILQRGSLTVLGDAIASFLEHSDKSTQGLSGFDKGDLNSNWGSLPTHAGLPWRKRAHRLMHGISPLRYYTSVSLFGVTVVITIVLLGLAVGADRARGSLYSSFRSNSITNKSPYAIIGFEAFASWNIAQIILLVNTPQLIMSILYFFYNSLFTSLVQAQEWNSYSFFRRPLRVSAPTGSQTSTFWLTLPPLYSVPLVLFSALLHWLISQAIFLFKIEFKGYAGYPSERFGGLGHGNVYGDYPGELLAAGYSSMAILLCLLLTIVLVVAFVALSWRRLKGDMVLAGSCSAIISAACHGSRDLDEKDSVPSWLQPLQWGEAITSEKEDVSVGRLAFSTGPVTSPIEGKTYQ